ncbi:MAG: thiamine pyrophosphate-dependent enzyme [Candidatus Micrarchaeia archaeon]|jgi:2-oxoglutarate ferredoxin oxidoreductase subunit beta
MAQIYTSGVKPVWCPGCGDYGVQAGILRALNELQIDKSKVVMVSGIGCSSAMPHVFSTYGIHSIHGRVLPVATGVKLANSDLEVIGTAGDGDAYGIGVAHLIHAARRNIDIAYIVMNNQIYGLTTGQASPTSLVGAKTKSTPFGDIEDPVNPLALALASGATFVARGFSGDPAHLSELIKEGIVHKGFALIDVFSPCVSFNTLNTYDWFRQRIYKLQGNNTSDLASAFNLATEAERSNWSKIPIGLFYKVERPTYNELDITLKKGSLAKQPQHTKEQVLQLLEEYR